MLDQSRKLARKNGGNFIRSKKEKDDPSTCVCLSVCLCMCLSRSRHMYDRFIIRRHCSLDVHPRTLSHIHGPIGIY